MKKLLTLLIVASLTVGVFSCAEEEVLPTNDKVADGGAIDDGDF
ncbi:MAG: hypothetical protein AAGF85_21395 [Bacteroidota bacterium]